MVQLQLLSEVIQKSTKNIDFSEEKISVYNIAPDHIFLIFPWKHMSQLAQDEAYNKTCVIRSAYTSTKYGKGSQLSISG